MKERAFGSIVASAVAGLFVMSAAHAADGKAPAAKAKADAPKTPYCQSACKLKSECKTATHACAGKNTEGKGILKQDNEAGCTKAGGTWIKA